MNNVEQIIEISKISSSWWAGVINNPKMDNGDESEIGALCMAFLTMLNEKEKITPEQQKQFRFKLYEFIKETLQTFDDDQILWLDVDYGPCKYLRDIANSCNINSNRFPLKTTMKITKHFVSVRYGYSSDFETLYADAYYYKKEIESYKETIDYYEKQDDSYFIIGSKNGNIDRCNKQIIFYENKLKELESNDTKNS